MSSVHSKILLMTLLPAVFRYGTAYQSFAPMARGRRKV
jgi:hypothetical protein